MGFFVFPFNHLQQSYYTLIILEQQGLYAKEGEFLQTMNWQLPGRTDMEHLIV